MRNILLLAAMLAMIASPALAAFTVDVSAPDDIYAGGNADIIINIHNSGATSFYTMSQIIASPEASTWSHVQGPVGIQIQMGTNGTFIVRFTPSLDAKAATYRFSFTVTEQTTSSNIENEWSTTVKQHVAAAVIRTFNLSCTECTAKEADFDVSVENVGTTLLRGFRVVMSGPGQQIPLDLGDVATGAKKTLRGKLNLEGTVPGSYFARAELTSDDGLMDSRIINFNIPLIKNVQVANGEFLLPWSRTVRYTAVNGGNAPDTATITATATPSPWVSLSFEQTPTSQSGNSVTWVVQLPPGTSNTVSYTEFYWPVPIIIIALLAGGVYAYFWITAIALKKKVTKKDGDWMISLTVANRGSAVDGVIVRDMVPSGFRLGAHFETLRPITRAIGGGTELVWRIGGMRKGEQRVLHYRINGNRAVDLPHARLTAKRGEKTILSSSSSTKLPGEKQKPVLKVAVDN
ncbi:MAG: hypothetical protein V1887_04295 [Candidatus Aenigmatarchaeota archaeon]